MPYGLYISAEGAQAQAQRIEVIANNLANVDTPGFKRDLAMLQARHSESFEQGLDYPESKSVNNIGGGVQVVEKLTEHANGVLKKTDSPSDIAIQGEGYFVVRHDDQDLLTRAGNFSFTSNGRLVTPIGDAVLDSSNNPIQVEPEVLGAHQGPYFNDRGSLIVGEERPLAMVKPEATADLVKFGKNFFHSLSETTQMPIGDRKTAPGFIEASGVNPITEMMTMIEANRAFEANVNLIKSQDEMLGGLVNRVLRQA